MSFRGNLKYINLRYITRFSCTKSAKSNNPTKPIASNDVTIRKITNTQFPHQCIDTKLFYAGVAKKVSGTPPGVTNVGYIVVGFPAKINCTAQINGEPCTHQGAEKYYCKWCNTFK